MSRTPEMLKIAVPGAAGQIGRYLNPMIASGDVFGRNRWVELRLLDTEAALPALKAIKMELLDSAFPRLRNVVVTADPEEAFHDASWGVNVAGMPRGPGKPRSELISINGPIMKRLAEAANKVAADDFRMLVSANPCNTLAAIASAHAPRFSPRSFFAMMRLDENRARSMLAQLLDVRIDHIRQLAVWGNHSESVFPDFLHATYAYNDVAKKLDNMLDRSTFIEAVRNRGAAVILANNGKSSAQSAAKAAADSLISISSATPKHDWTSLGVVSSGEYGVPRGLFCGFPITTNGLQWSIVPGLTFPHWAQHMIDRSVRELVNEALEAQRLGLLPQQHA